jgi:hypothetical protein
MRDEYFVVVHAVVGVDDTHDFTVLRRGYVYFFDGGEGNYNFHFFYNLNILK